MDPWHQIKEEFVESGSISFSGNAPAAFPAPQPLECLHEGGPPPFLNKTYEMVDDPESNEIVSWCGGGQSFVVWDPNAFSTNLLPRFFKHSNFSSFVRQLNTYGFRKIDPDKWEFANEGFVRDQKHLMKNIRRRRTSSSSHQSFPLQQGSLETCIEDGVYGVEEEVGRLKRDKQVLLSELVKIKQQQQTTRTYLKSMENRLQNAELKQQQMMNFLAKAIQNPGFLQQLSQQNGRRKVLEELLSKKRSRYIDSSSSSSSIGRFRTDGVIGMMSHVKDELSDYGGGYQVSELEALALEMQGFGRAGKEVRDDADHGLEEEEGCRIRELDDEFWNELFSEEMSDNSGGSHRSL